MPSSDAIAAQMPYLRRYARAVTGCQSTGDAQVVSTLEAIVANPAMLDPGSDPRVALYRSFSSMLNRNAGSAQAAPLVDGAGADAGPAERNLAAITPLPRQAFLLLTLEQFSAAEAASVLGVAEHEVKALVDRAGREIAGQVATTVVIIEDEPLIAMDLERIVQQLGHRVCGLASTHRQAVELVRLHRPGLVLADIHLADGGSGLEAVKEILAGLEVPVIFVTAYPEQLLTGSRPEPTFLVTKPFRAELLKAVISQALFFDTKPRSPPTAGH